MGETLVTTHGFTSGSITTQMGLQQGWFSHMPVIGDVFVIED